MTEWEFDLVFADIEDVDEAHEALFDAGCDDVTVSYSNGEVCLSFIREAEGFAQAVIGALADVTKAHMGGTLIRIAPDDLVRYKKNQP